MAGTVKRIAKGLANIIGGGGKFQEASRVSGVLNTARSSATNGYEDIFSESSMRKAYGNQKYDRMEKKYSRSGPRQAFSDPSAVPSPRPPSTYAGTGTFNRQAAQSAENIGADAKGMADNYAPGQGYAVNPDKGYFGNMGSHMGSNVMSRYGDGWGIAKGALGHATRGAVVGAAIEGTNEYAQGGSFWTGAKAGAFDGAVGWTGYKMAGAAFGATSRNPFKKSGPIGSAMNMHTSVSKQVKAIARNRADAENILL